MTESLGGPSEVTRRFMGEGDVAARRTIDRETLKRYIDAGLSLTEMAEHWETETGTTRARSSFAVAMSRYNMTSAHPQVRHDDTLPWRVKSKHAMEYPARMLRALGRRNKGLPIGEELSDRLDSYLRDLDKDNAVVHYDAETPEGFWHVPREPQDKGYIRQPRADK